MMGSMWKIRKAFVCKEQFCSCFLFVVFVSFYFKCLALLFPSFLTFFSFLVKPPEDSLFLFCYFFFELVDEQTNKEIIKDKPLGFLERK